MEPEGPLLRSEEPATPYSQQDQSSTHFDTPCYSKTYFNIILSSTDGKSVVFMPYF